MTGAEFIVPTLVIVLPIAIAVTVVFGAVMERTLKRLFDALVDRWERREVAKLSPEEQEAYWAEKEARQ